LPPNGNLLANELVYGGFKQSMPRCGLKRLGEIIQAFFGILDTFFESLLTFFEILVSFLEILELLFVMFFNILVSFLEILELLFDLFPDFGHGCIEQVLIDMRSRCFSFRPSRCFSFRLLCRMRLVLCCGLA
jgi:hypothetical protein